jgi:cellulose synthase/poly-beta-1,6-N-acetylglucosamine synthase-like glycosyltransferase
MDTPTPEKARPEAILPQVLGRPVFFLTQSETVCAHVSFPTQSHTDSNSSQRAVTIILATTLLFLLPVMAVTAFFAVEVLAGLRPDRISPPGQSTRARAAIVVPAHNEERVIGQTISALRQQAPRTVPVFVVADNCVDRTGEIARLAGATVIVRNEPDRRGKGFALAAAREHLRSAPPDVVIVIDADCRIDRQSLTALIAEVARSSRSCQAVNLLAPDLRAAALVQISNFAFMIKNLVRQRGLQRLADRVHLTGTGMALPWNMFDSASLATTDIVEDLSLGLELADGATAPMLVSTATVWSPAASSGGTLVQRQRWEGGYLAVALKIAPRALARALRLLDLKGVAAALDLCVPPVALLALLNVAALIVAGLCLVAGGPTWPLAVQLSIGLVAALAIAAAWFFEGRAFASALTLLGFPFYILWKLPMYLGLAWRGPPKDWLRSGR